MALNLQGFEKALNLSESSQDRQILNNLGGGEIASDIALFRNNLRNVSTLVWQPNLNQSSITNNTRFVFPTTVPFVFTNGDRVKLSGSTLGSFDVNTTYFVVGLQVGLGLTRNQLAFGLAATKGGSLLSLAGISAAVTFTRPDEVTRENINNIMTPPTQEVGVTIEGSRFSYSIGPTFTAAFETIDGYIDTSNFIRTQKYTTNTSIATDRKIAIEGVVLSNDPASFNTSNASLAQPNSPGIYITNPFSDVTNITKARAYSTNAQPWIEGVGKLVTKSTQVNIGDLYFEKEIKISEYEGITEITASPLPKVSEFTHKLPVNINGVDYYVLVKAA